VPWTKELAVSRMNSAVSPLGPFREPIHLLGCLVSICPPSVRLQLTRPPHALVLPSQPCRPNPSVHMLSSAVFSSTQLLEGG
jgi:hypothetical protein